MWLINNNYNFKNTQISVIFNQYYYFTLVTTQVVEAAVEAEAIKTTKAEATQEEEATNTKSSSEAAQGEAREGEDTEATPHKPQDVHDEDVEGPVVKDPSNYESLYFNIKALVLVNMEYTTPNQTKPVINLNSNSNPLSNITTQTGAIITQSTRDISINKAPSKEIKADDDGNKQKAANEIQPDKGTNKKGNKKIKREIIHKWKKV